MFGVQFDSVAPLTFTPALQAFYVNGDYAHTPVSFGRGRVWVDVLATAPKDAFWLDVETGDATPADFPGWLDARGAAGGGYCNRSTLPALVSAAGTRPWSLWLATLDGTADPAAISELAALPSTVTLVAIQAFPASMLGIDADLSVILDQNYWTTRALGAAAT